MGGKPRPRFACYAEIYLGHVRAASARNAERLARKRLPADAVLVVVDVTAERLTDESLD